MPFSGQVTQKTTAYRSFLTYGVRVPFGVAPMSLVPGLPQYLF